MKQLLPLSLFLKWDDLLFPFLDTDVMDSLAPPEPPFQETLQSPLFPVTIETPSPYEYPINLSATSTPPSYNPLEPMDAYKLFHLSEKSMTLTEF